MFRSIRERLLGRLTQTRGVAFASAREFNYLLRDERGDGVASIDELERAQRVLSQSMVTSSGLNALLSSSCRMGMVGTPAHLWAGAGRPSPSSPRGR